MMKRVSLLMLALLMAVSVQATVIDDFDDGDVSDWTSTVILDTDESGGSNTSALDASTGQLALVTSSYQSIEQYALIKDGVSLNVGEELQVDVTITGDSLDIGLYVGGADPVTGVRSDYVTVYARDTGELFARGFNGTSELGQVGWVSPDYSSLFIARIDASTYEVGYYLTNGDRVVMTTRTDMTGVDGSVVGLYADVRGTGTLGYVDNMRIVPEPATMALLGMGMVALRRRRK